MIMWLFSEDFGDVINKFINKINGKKWEKLWIHLNIFSPFLTILFSIPYCEFTVKRKFVKIFSHFGVNFQMQCTVLNLWAN